MRFHVLGLPHTVSSKEFNACAYTQKVVKFCKMMSARGHYIIHYGHEDSDVICNEQVSVITNKDWKIAYGDYDWRKNFFKFDVEDYAYKTFFKNAIKEVGKRKQPLDFILPFWGSGVRPICDAHSDMICVEPGIGYAGGHWARWKIFESYAIYHAYCGMKNVSNCNQDWYEVVIPNYFDLEDFDYSEEKDDYFLFLGRVYDGKGINAAVQMTEKIGAKLIVAGQNPDNMTFPKHVEYVGYADIDTRRRLLSRAKGLIIASMYIEPFGGVQVEALLSGTPTITTDWGAFTENNINGLTGYRCRTFEDFVNAGKNIDKIKPSDCRKFAEKFSLDNVALMYEKYFQDVLNVYTNKGWYHIENDIIDYDQIESEEKPFANRLATWIKENINPKKVVDIGCGPGTYVYSLRDNGINAYGYDIDDRVDGKDYLKKLSLFEINDKSDVVICLEVAEHIETSLSDSIVDSIIRNVNDDGIIIWTAAIPGQGGVGHINCQKKEYWEEKFISRGFHRDCAIESNLLEYIRSGPYMGWFLQNLMVFKDVYDSFFDKLDSEDIFFTIVGAMDGVNHDNTFKYAFKNKHWKGLLIEPMRDYFQKLNENYEYRENLIFENVAISDSEGYEYMLRIPSKLIESGEVPSWSDGISTFYPEKNVMREEHLISKAVKEPVLCTTFENISNKHSIEKIDVLQIDVEGCDSNVFWQIWNLNYRPKLIIIEIVNMQSEEKNKIEKTLKNNSYNLSYVGDDLVATKEN